MSRKVVIKCKECNELLDATPERLRARRLLKPNTCDVCAVLVAAEVKARALLVFDDVEPAIDDVAPDKRDEEIKRRHEQESS